MPVPELDYRDSDRQIWEQELDEFVPQCMFDAHFHLYNDEHMDNSNRPHGSDKLFADVYWSDALEWSNILFPGREPHYLCLCMPLPGIDVDTHNYWVADQAKADPKSRVNMLVTPDSRVDKIEHDMQTVANFVGFKVYRWFTVTDNIHRCRIQDFFTHEQMELANDLGCWVTMHLSQYDGCADKDNLKDLEEYTGKRYPKIKWILAHCARSFTYWPIRQAADRLRAMPNIWYDLSAVTDVRPFITLFQKENTKRLMYGSDGVCANSHHGNYPALGRAWSGMDADKMEFKYPHCDGRPIVSIYEQILSMKHAAEVAELSRDDIEDIFWRNAYREFGIEA